MTNTLIDYFMDRWIPSLPLIYPIGSWKTSHQAKDSFDRRRRLKKFSRETKPFQALWQPGIRLWITPGEEVSACAYIHGFYEPNQLSLVRQILKSGSVFIDIGAHIGLYSLFASKCVEPNGQVYAFEPSPRERDRLDRHITLNQMANISVYPVAVYDREAQIDLKVARHPHSGHNTLGQFAYTETIEDSSPKVKSQTLDSWTQENAIQQIDLIKIDAEGSEQKILFGAKKTIEQFRPIIMIEITSLSLKHQNSTVESVWNDLTQLNYILFAYDPQTGLPYRVKEHPGIDHTDFVAIPKEKQDSKSLKEIFHGN